MNLATAGKSVGGVVALSECLDQYPERHSQDGLGSRSWTPVSAFAGDLGLSGRSVPRAAKWWRRRIPLRNWASTDSAACHNDSPGLQAAGIGSIAWKLPIVSASRGSARWSRKGTD